MPENAPDSNGYPGTECCGMTDIMLTLAETYFGKLDEVWVQLERKQRLRQLQQRMTSGEREEAGEESLHRICCFCLFSTDSAQHQRRWQHNSPICHISSLQYLTVCRVRDLCSYLMHVEFLDTGKGDSIDGVFT